MTTQMPKIMAVEADSRGRVLLGKDAAGSTYRMSKSPDGTILLEPARLYTESEIAVLSSPRIAEGLNAAKEGTFKGVEFDRES